MKTTLEKIQNLARIGGIVCKVLMVCSIVASCLSLVGIISLALGMDKIIELGNMTISGMVKAEAELTTGDMYISMVSSMILSAASAVVFWFAMNYFENEQEEGTPFTEDGAKEIFRLGIITMVVPLAGDVLSELISAILANVFSIEMKMSVSEEGFLVAGALFLVMSLIFRYGAEIVDGKEEEEGKEEK